MDKNTTIGWLLIGLLMITMMMVMKNQNPPVEEVKEEQTEQTTNRDSNQIPTTNKEETSTQNTSVTTAEVTTLTDSMIQQQASYEFGVFGKFSQGEEEEIVVETEDLIITFTNHGAVPKTVELKNYKTHDQEPLIVFSKETGAFNFVINAGTRAINTDELYFNSSISKLDNGDQVIKFKLPVTEGNYYEHEFTVPATGYLIDFNVNAKKLQDIISSRAPFFTVDLQQRFESLEGNLASERMYSSVYYAGKDYDVDKIGLRKSGDKQISKDVKWVSFKQKFFSSVIIAKGNFDENGTVKSVKPEEKDHVKDVTTKLEFTYTPQDDYSFPMQLFYGPNDYKDLKSYDINLQQTVQIGVSVFRWVNLYLIIPTFNFLNRFIPNYGIIILILTFLIKMIVFPFTFKSHLSMIKMRVLQPELAELKKKFGKDQQKMGTAQMDLYRKAGVNPLGGCLPMVFQMPILIAMYRFFPSSLELRQQSFLWAKDLSTYDAIITWNQEIPFLSDAIGNHISLFTVLMAITSFFYTKLNSQNTPVDSSNPMAAQMKTFQYIMPFMMFFIFNKFSAALSYYYFLFNLISIGQYWVMKRFMIDEDKIHAQIQANKKKVRKKSKWQGRMEDMMKQQQENQKKKK